MSNTPIIDSLIEELVLSGTIPKERKPEVVVDKRPQHLVMKVLTRARRGSKIC
ncbi:hypothetical protein GNF82_14260 [Clostridium perfringens]